MPQTDGNGKAPLREQSGLQTDGLWAVERKLYRMTTIVQQNRFLKSLDEATPEDFQRLGLPDLRHIPAGLRPFSYSPVMMGRCPVPPDYYSHVAEVCQKLGVEYNRPDLDPRVTIQPYEPPTPPPPQPRVRPVATAEPVPVETEVDRLRRELAEAYEKMAALERENATLKHEVTYQRDWGSNPLMINQDTVTIGRETLKQVALCCLDASQAPRTAAPLFLYILSQSDEHGIAALEATAVSRDLLKLENRRSWANLLGPIFGTLVTREGHHLRLNVTGDRYQSTESNPPPLLVAQPSPSESDGEPLQDEKTSPPVVTNPENVTVGRHISPVILNDGDINHPASLGSYHQSTPLPPDTKHRLDNRQRQLFAMNFNRDVAAKYQWVILDAPDETWESWLEQAHRGKSPAALMCDKIKTYHERNVPKVIPFQGKTG